MPTVSIITPLYNKGPYVAETLGSVRAQTVAGWELIVVENGSSDDGPEQVRHLADRDDRIRLVASPRRGPGAARNFGLAHATGEWVLFLDADDLIEPAYLEMQLAAAARHPNASIIAGFWQEFRDDDGRKMVLHEPSGLSWSRPKFLDYAIAYTCWAIHAAIIRRNALGVDTAWPEELDCYLAEDTVFWFRLVDAHEVAYSQCKGALYRTQTPGCRTQSQVVEAWFAGLHAAANANVAWLEQHGRAPTAGQMESLFRLYTGLYVQARCQSNPAFAKTARHQAEAWLSRRRETGGLPGWSIRLATRLGVPIFAILSSWRLKMRSKTT